VKFIRYFELHDQSWMPKFLRQGVTDYLSQLLNYYQLYQPATFLLAKLIQTTGYNKLIDFCSGSGGMLMGLQQTLQKEYNLTITMELTDKFPHPILTTNSDLSISYQPLPVDVLHTNQPYHAIRTLFTAFHHFNPQEAFQILSQAVNNNDPIAIFEFNERSWKRCLLDCIIPFSVFHLTPKIKPTSKKRFIFTYLLPILPIMIWWDGIVSNIRTYSVDELKTFVANLEASHYHWQIGKVPAGLRFYPITYLIGWPKEKKHV